MPGEVFFLLAFAMTLGGLFLSTLLLASAAQASVIPLTGYHDQPLVSRYGTKYNVSRVLDNPLGGKLRYVENSGVCGWCLSKNIIIQRETFLIVYSLCGIETTPGVYQASGYADLNSAQSMFFWFFESRNSPSTAPLSIWLNGGVGHINFSK